MNHELNWIKALDCEAEHKKTIHKHSCAADSMEVLEQKEWNVQEMRKKFIETLVKNFFKLKSVNNNEADIHNSFIWRVEKRRQLRFECDLKKLHKSLFTI